MLGKSYAIEPLPGTPRPSGQPSRSAPARFHGQPARGQEWRVLRERRTSSAQCGCLVASRPANPAARTCRQLREVEAAAQWASDRHFDFARGHGQWQAEFGPDSQAFADGIGDVRLHLGLGLPLADAARYRRALANIDAVFVLIDADNEFHTASYFSSCPRSPDSARTTGWLGLTARTLGFAAGRRCPQECGHGRLRDCATKPQQRRYLLRGDRMKGAGIRPGVGD